MTQCSDLIRRKKHSQDFYKWKCTFLVECPSYVFHDVFEYIVHTGNQLSNQLTRGVWLSALSISHCKNTTPVHQSHAEAIIMDNSASHPSGFNEADKNIHTGTHGYAKIHTNSRTNANTQPYKTRQRPNHLPHSLILMNNQSDWSAVWSIT